MWKSGSGVVKWIYTACVRAVSVYSCGCYCECLPLVAWLSYLPFIQEPFPIANPEQTASILSFILWIFLDPIIFKASRVKHLGHDQLPPLADYDTAKNLIKRGYRVRHSRRMTNYQAHYINF